MKTDPALAAVRRVREQISREFDNDPVRLIAHYVELQQRHRGRVLHGPGVALEEEPPPNKPLQPTAFGRG